MLGPGVAPVAASVLPTLPTPLSVEPLTTVAVPLTLSWLGLFVAPVTSSMSTSAVAPATVCVLPALNAPLDITSLTSAPPLTARMLGGVIASFTARVSGVLPAIATPHSIEAPSSAYSLSVCVPALIAANMPPALPAAARILPPLAAELRGESPTAATAPLSDSVLGLGFAPDTVRVQPALLGLIHSPPPISPPVCPA